MSAFGNYLLHLLHERQREDPDFTAGQFAEELGISTSMFSRFTTGDALSCNQKTLAKICSRVSKNINVQAELQAAFLRDQRVEPGGSQIKVIVLGDSARLREKAPDEVELDGVADEMHLDLKTRKAVRDVLEACGKSRRMGRMLHDLADFARREK